MLWEYPPAGWAQDPHRVAQGRNINRVEKKPERMSRKLNQMPLYDSYIFDLDKDYLLGRKPDSPRPGGGAARLGKV